MTPQPEFNFTCPSLWTDGAVENLVCVIPRSKFRFKTSGGRCAVYGDSVEFMVTQADGTKSTACTVSRFDNTCDGSVNVDGCGCREISGGNIVIDYNVRFDRASLEGAHWECEPQCLDGLGKAVVLKPPNTTDCFDTNFRKYIGIYSSYLINCFHCYHENQFRRHR